MVKLTLKRKEEIRVLGWQIWESNVDWRTLAKAAGAEMLGMFLFVFLATGTVTSGCHTGDVASASGNSNDKSLTNVVEGSCFLQSTTLLNIALGFGFMLFVVIYFTASFSGGHINPAVSLAMFLTKRISLLRGLVYTISQCGGAVIASLVLRGIDKGGYKAAAGAANQVNTTSGATVGTALGLEIILTFALVFVVFAATDAERALSTAPLPILAPFSVGMVVFVCHMVAVPIDGCSINPARSFGPAVVTHHYQDFWVFWVGPYTGAAVASVLYELGFKSRKKGKGQGEANQADIESGIPVASGAHKHVHTGQQGLDESYQSESETEVEDKKQPTSRRHLQNGEKS